MSEIAQNQNINIAKADNGGYVLRWTFYKPTMKHSESLWEDHQEVFKTEEKEAMLERVKSLFKENLQQISADMEKDAVKTDL